MKPPTQLGRPNMELNVLYQSDDFYAPQTGVSITSLLENNKDFEEITIFLLDDQIERHNLEKLQKVVDSYGRKLSIISTRKIKDKLIELDVIPYKGSYTTYLKLFAIGDIDTSNGLLLQIDGDTIINDSLAGLFDIDMREYVCAATYDCLQNSYKSLIGLSPSEKYYNCGVLWINQDNWRAHNCQQRISDHLRNTRSRYLTVDQDIINVLFRNEITYLDISYNLNSGFYLYGVEGSFYIYDLDESFFSKKDQVAAALAHPIINHCMSPQAGRPWEKNNEHPQNTLYDTYLKMSPWKDTPKIIVKKKPLFKIEWLLYKMLPEKMYQRIHKRLLKAFLKKKDKDTEKTYDLW